MGAGEDMAIVETTSVPSYCSWISVLSDAPPQIQQVGTWIMIITSARVSIISVIKIHGSHASFSKFYSSQQP